MENTEEKERRNLRQQQVKRASNALAKRIRSKMSSTARSRGDSHTTNNKFDNKKLSAKPQYSELLSKFKRSTSHERDEDLMNCSALVTRFDEERSNMNTQRKFCGGVERSTKAQVVNIESRLPRDRTTLNEVAKDPKIQSKPELISVSISSSSSDSTSSFSESLNCTRKLAYCDSEKINTISDTISSEISLPSSDKLIRNQPKVKPLTKMQPKVKHCEIIPESRKESPMSKPEDKISGRPTFKSTLEGSKKPTITNVIGHKVNPNTYPKNKFSEITDFITNMQITSENSSLIQCKNLKENVDERSIQNSKVQTDSIRTTKKPLNEIKTMSNQPVNNNVKFYDYNNKFVKEFPRSNNMCNRYAGENVNAFENAAVDNNVNEFKDVRLEGIKKRIDQRCQKALEKEKIQLEYNDLTAKLEALGSGRFALPTDGHFCHVQDGKLKQTQINNKFEDILRKDIVITCAPITNVCSTSHVKTGVISNFSQNSSESCSSIVLEQFNKEIISQNTVNSDNLLKLQNLLRQINCLRSNLISEVEKLSKTKNANRKLRKSNKKTIDEEKAKKKKSKLVTKQKRVLESRILDYYKSKDRSTKFAANQVRKKSMSQSSSDLSKNDKQLKAKIRRPTKLYKDKLAKNMEQVRIENLKYQSHMSSSTSYCSLPDAMGNALNKMLTEMNSEFISEKKARSEALASPKDNEPTFKSDYNKIGLSSKKDMNPQLANYIQRLLGMPRSSIDALGVSSSEIETPSSSLVNITSNWPTEYLGEKAKINDLRNYIEQNCRPTSSNKGQLETPKAKINEDKNQPIKDNSLKTQETRKPIPHTKQKLARKYSELTATCEKRIEELTEMIEKVRMEKQKIFEISISTGSSDKFGHSTEYLEPPKDKDHLKAYLGNSQVSNITKEIPESDKPQREDTGSNKIKSAIVDHSEDISKYRRFVSFDEYARQHNLDITKFDSEFSMLLQNGFQEYIEQIINDPQFEYNQFSMSNLKMLDKSQADSFKDIINNLRLSNIQINSFVSENRYIQNSLNDNKTIGNSHSSSSDTLPDIAEELQRRDIISRPFRKNVLTEDLGKLPSLNRPEESLESVTISHSQQFEVNWKNVNSNKSNSISNEDSSNKKVTKSMKLIDNTSDEISGNDGRSLNIREFLMKELQKRTDCTMSSTNTDDSLTNIFLQSILGQMTPSPKEISLSKQKTSTPVQSHSSTTTSGGGSSKLFSGESRLSSVHCNETTMQ